MKKKKDIDTLPEELKQAKIIEIANMALAGTSMREICRKKGITTRQATNILNHEIAIQYFKEVETQSRRMAKSRIRDALNNFVPQMITRLKEQIEEAKNPVEALKLGFRLTGALDEDKSDGTDNRPINIILPGKREEVINVDSRQKSDDSSSEP